jgi:hypothetical protein
LEFVCVFGIRREVGLMLSGFDTRDFMNLGVMVFGEELKRVVRKVEQLRLADLAV